MMLRNTSSYHHQALQSLSPPHPMTITARELSLNVLQSLESGSEHSDTLLHRQLQHSALNRVNRALATALVNGVLRYRFQLDFIISHFYHHKLEKAAPMLRNILRLGAYQLLFLDKVPDWAAVNECVKLARKYKGDRMSKLVNGVLRKITHESVTLEAWLHERGVTEQLALRYSHPEWLVERWLTAFGLEKTEAIMKYNNQFPLFGFRINRLKTSPEQLFGEVDVAVEYEPCLLDNFFVSKDFHSFEAAVADGRLTVQNPTQGEAVRLLNPQPNEIVLDLCAAPGGKATFMAELMQNSGQIIAVDRYDQKLAALDAHAKALGLTIITTVAADARSYQPDVQPDAILLDASCSGTGVLGRRAELRWKVSREMLLELQTLQAALLDHAATLLNDGGRLLYATCSIEPEENHLQIEAFLQRHPEFSATPAGGKLTLPGDHHGCDGGFSQLLLKKRG